MNIYTLILCGGVGARLWPLSRKLLPKQFARILKGQTLFERTAQRNAQLGAQILIASNRDQRFLAENQLDQLGLCAAGGLIEPVGRNTAPAVALSALQLNSDDILVVCPSDHVIRKDQAYRQAMELGIHLASQGSLVTFGIKPEYPEIGYGYIEAGSPIDISDFLKDHNSVSIGPSVEPTKSQSKPNTELPQLNSAQVTAFHEKPDLDRAQQYLESGNFFWNSGMFAFSAGSFLEEYKTHSPNGYKACLEAWQNQGSPKISGAPFNEAKKWGQSTQARHIQDHKNQRQSTGYTGNTSSFEPSLQDMESIPSDSIDYAVMEKTKKAVVIPCDLGWSDLGSLEALGDYLDGLEDPVTSTESSSLNSKDRSNSHEQRTSNTIDAYQHPIIINSQGNLILGEQRQIALIDMDDTMVIETPDALLVAKRGSGQKVKQVVDQLAKKAPQYTIRFPRVERPWGDYTTLEVQPGRTIRTISIKPGWTTSLHYHHHRTETWTITQGEATITLGDKSESSGGNIKISEKMCSVPLTVGQTFTVIPNQPHRIENRGTDLLKLVEIQLEASRPKSQGQQTQGQQNQDQQNQDQQSHQDERERKQLNQSRQQIQIIDESDMVRLEDPRRI
jgi:mannose-1-phosphate guanylyltransferase